MGRRIPLTVSCWNYDRTRAIEQGLIAPRGIDLAFLPHAPEETFFRMMRWQEFDVAEMSLSSYVLTLFADEPPFVAVPVFPSRVFRHGSIYLAQGSTIREPGELAGKTVGVPEYQMTASVWIRGMLQEHHGVPADSVRYRTGGLHEKGRSEKLVLDLPAEFDVRPIGPTQTLDAMLCSGEIDALYTARVPQSFDAGADRIGHVRRLFPDVRAAERAYFADTGVFPIMHTLVIRREVYERNRWIARSLLDAFTAAKNAVYPDLHELTALKAMLPWTVQDAEETVALMGGDFWPYGVEANHATLSTFLNYSHQQGLAKRVLTPEELFAPETLESVRI